VLRVAVAPDGAAGLEREVALPSILGTSDVARYKRIFELQVAGDWHAADDVIATLDDRVLMGHVMVQRYMHPTAYRSKFKELRDWLADYADLPQAKRVYRLAMRRKPASARAPRKPVLPIQPRVENNEAAPKTGYKSPRKRTKAQRNKLIAIIKDMRRHIRRGQVARAAEHLWAANFKKLADEFEFDTLRRDIAHGFLIKGDDAKAFEYAAASAARSGAAIPKAHWTAGLAAFRQGELDAAREHFEALAISSVAKTEMIAAGAFWAARVSLITRRPQHVSRFLEIAATAPRSFYGLLALRALAGDPGFTWQPPPLTDRDLEIVRRVPAAIRALALAQVDQHERAELELRRLRADASPALGRAMLAIATRLRLPTAQLRIARSLSTVDGRRHDGGLYPLPSWTPEGGYRVDRALIYALIRQESQFNTQAKSRAGARGLMQLMPSTASFISGDRRYRKSHRRKLFVPEISIELGQTYLLHLAAQPEIADNLFYMVAAYNGGPGNLNKWRRRQTRDDDPLLFVETLPSRETRGFIKSVFTNFWAYRAQLGQATPSLDAVAGGRWPAYVPLDPTSVAVNVEN
jgi:soluble lytic murein transglycosylase-like protein